MGKKSLKYLKGKTQKGLPGGPNEVNYSFEGYKMSSTDRFNPYNIIPSGNITMQNVPHPVLGIDNLGNSQMMMPGMDYTFSGSEVFELPIRQKGGGTRGKNVYVKMPDGEVKYLNTDSEEYREMYNSGRLGSVDAEGNFYAVEMPEVTVETDRRDWLGEGADAMRAFAYSPLAAASGALQVPQSLMVEGIEAMRGNPYSFKDALDFNPMNKPVDEMFESNQRVPSEAWNIENPYAAFAVDVLADPSNLFGAGAARNMAKSSGKGLVTNYFGKKGLKKISKDIATELPGSPNNSKQIALDQINSWKFFKKNKKALHNKVNDPFTNKEIDNELREEYLKFIKNRDLKHKTNYESVFKELGEGQNYNLIDPIEGEGLKGASYYGIPHDFSNPLGGVSRMRMPHTLDFDYLSKTNKTKPDLSKIVIESNDPIVFGHEFSHANDLAQDYLKRFDAGVKLQDFIDDQWSKQNYSNPDIYAELKRHLLMKDPSSVNEFNKSLLQNPVSRKKHYKNSIKDVLGESMVGDGKLKVTDKFKKSINDRYDYLLGKSEVKARLTDIKKEMVNQGIIKNEAKPVTQKDLDNFIPYHNEVEDVINLYKNKSDLLNDLSKIGVLSTIPVGITINTSNKAKGGLVKAQNGKGISSDLLIRQQYKESTFNPKAESPAGAKGVAQIMPNVWGDAVKAGIVNEQDDIYDPSVNKKVQEWYMNDLYNSSFINKPNQSDQVRLAKTLAAYNWGRGNLVNYLNSQKESGIDIYNSTDWLKGLPFETKDYVNKILLSNNDKFNKSYKEGLKKYKLENGGEPDPDVQHDPYKKALLDYASKWGYTIPSESDINSLTDDKGYTTIKDREGNLIRVNNKHGVTQADKPFNFRYADGKIKGQGRGNTPIIEYLAGDDDLNVPGIAVGFVKDSASGTQKMYFTPTSDEGAQRLKELNKDFGVGVQLGEKGYAQMYRQFKQGGQTMYNKKEIKPSYNPVDMVNSENPFEDKKQGVLNFLRSNTEYAQNEPMRKLEAEYAKFMKKCGGIVKKMQGGGSIPPEDHRNIMFAQDGGERDWDKLRKEQEARDRAAMSNPFEYTSSRPQSNPALQAAQYEGALASGNENYDKVYATYAENPLYDFEGTEKKYRKEDGEKSTFIKQGSGKLKGASKLEGEGYKTNKMERTPIRGVQYAKDDEGNIIGVSGLQTGATNKDITPYDMPFENLERVDIEGDDKMHYMKNPETGTMVAVPSSPEHEAYVQEFNKKHLDAQQIEGIKDPEGNKINQMFMGYKKYGGGLRKYPGGGEPGVGSLVENNNPAVGTSQFDPNAQYDNPLTSLRRDASGNPVFVPSSQDPQAIQAANYANQNYSQSWTRKNADTKMKKGMYQNLPQHSQLTTNPADFGSFVQVDNADDWREDVVRDGIYSSRVAGLPGYSSNQTEFSKANKGIGEREYIFDDTGNVVDIKQQVNTGRSSSNPMGTGTGGFMNTGLLQYGGGLKRAQEGVEIISNGNKPVTPILTQELIDKGYEIDPNTNQVIRNSYYPAHTNTFDEDYYIDPTTGQATKRREVRRPYAEFKNGGHIPYGGIPMHLPFMQYAGQYNDNPFDKLGQAPDTQGMMNNAYRQSEIAQDPSLMENPYLPKRGPAFDQNYAINNPIDTQTNMDPQAPQGSYRSVPTTAGIVKNAMSAGTNTINSFSNWLEEQKRDRQLQEEGMSSQNVFGASRNQDRGDYWEEEFRPDRKGLGSYGRFGNVAQYGKQIKKYQNGAQYAAGELPFRPEGTIESSDRNIHFGTGDAGELLRYEMPTQGPGVMSTVDTTGYSAGKPFFPQTLNFEGESYNSQLPREQVDYDLIQRDAVKPRYQEGGNYWSQDLDSRMIPEDFNNTRLTPYGKMDPNQKQQIIDNFNRAYTNKAATDESMRIMNEMNIPQYSVDPMTGGRTQMNYQAGGEYDLTQDQIMEILRKGGEIEFLD